MELYKQLRPKALDEVVGQDAAVKLLQGYLHDDKVPHAILFSGPSGSGKTTLAHALTRALEIPSLNVTELNAASLRGIDVVREIEATVQPVGLYDIRRAYIIDEAHQLTKEAIQAWLKVLESNNPSVYYFFCSTESDKLPDTFISRVATLQLKPLSRSSLIAILNSAISRVMGKSASIDEEYVLKIVSKANGNARLALQLLEQVLTLISHNDQPNDLDVFIDAVVSGIQTSKTKAIEFIRALFKRTSWAELVGILTRVDDLNYESLRIFLVNYATSVMLNKQTNDVTLRVAANVLKHFMFPLRTPQRADFTYKLYCVLLDENQSSFQSH